MRFAYISSGIEFALPLFMARTHDIESKNVFYIQNMTRQKKPFPMPIGEAWEIFSEYLYFTKHAFDLKLYAFCLTENQIRLLAQAPLQNLSEAMLYFFRETSRYLNKRGKTINQIWGDQFLRCEINSDLQFRSVYKYLYRTPVDLSYVDRVEAYEYSSLFGIIGCGSAIIPIEPDEDLFHDLRRHLNWLNTLPTTTQTECIRRALKRKRFDLPNLNARKNPLEKYLY